MKKENIKSLLGILVLGILIACTAHAQQISKQITEKARNSTVQLVSRWNGHLIGKGSGFFIERDQIVTNIHVVAGADKVTAKLVGKKTEYTIEGVTAFDVKNDLVILQTTEKSGKPLALGEINAIEPGASIFAVGTPDGGEEGQITQGTFHSIRESDGQLRLKTKISPGNSGGPVLNGERAEVVGVAVTGSEKFNISYAIPSNMLRELLKRRRSDDTVKPLHEWSDKKAVFAYVYLRSISETPTNKAKTAKDAVKKLNNIISDHPHLAAFAYEHKGKLLLDNDYKAAIKNFKKLTELMPDYSLGYYHLGNAFLKSADLESAAKAKIPQYKKAIDNFTEAIGLIPFADAYFYQGLAKWELGQSKGDHEEALSLYEAAIIDMGGAIDLKKDYADAYQSRRYMQQELALVYISMGNYEKATSLNKGAAADALRVHALKQIQQR